MISVKTQNDLNVVLSGNDIGLAGHIAEQAIERGETHELLFTIAAQIRRESGDHHGAVALYLRAVELAPDNPDILTAAGDAMRYIGQLNQAIALFDRAIMLEKTMVSAWYGRALAFEAQGGLAEALISYLRVTELEPNLASGFAAIALLQVQSGDISEARKNAERAQLLGSKNYETIFALANCDFSEGRYLSAIELLRSLLQYPALPAENEIVVHRLIGDSMDKLGLVEEAFTSYSLANDRFGKLHAARNSSPIALQAISSIDAGVSKLPKDALRTKNITQENDAVGHIFILGYPRSGTTLTEQILATIPDVVTLEEESTFATAEKFLHAEGIKNLAVLNENEIDQLRRDYWSIVAKSGVDVNNKTFVDMDPLKGAALPLIKKLFPRAKIIIMHRDPRDVIWSCYRNNFIYSPATYEFTSLKRASSHYNAMDLNVHILKYEDLVRDFDNTTKYLCQFLDLPWSSDLHNFSTNAHTRTIRTASSQQVRQGLFDGTGQWRKYSDYLAPFAPLLEPWIEPSALLRTA
jgi:tetratricopeptide (TPR) repeat protein